MNFSLGKCSKHFHYHEHLLANVGLLSLRNKIAKSYYCCNKYSKRFPRHNKTLLRNVYRVILSSINLLWYTENKSRSIVWSFMITTITYDLVVVRGVNESGHSWMSCHHLNRGTLSILLAQKTLTFSFGILHVSSSLYHWAGGQNHGMIFFLAACPQLVLLNHKYGWEC